MTDRLDLPLRYREQIEALLREHLPEVEAWAYGSRVNGRSHEASDLDLVLRSPTLEPVPGDRYVDFVEAVEQSNIPILVQAHDWARLPESFHHEIERDHVVVLAGSSTGGATSDAATLTIRSGKWRDFPFSEAMHINPTVSLNRGVTYPFVDMAAVNAGSRSALPSGQREFKGGGSRFQSGDTLMARITPCLENGKIARYQAPDSTDVAHGSTEFIVIRGRPQVTDNDFAYYLTRWEEVRNYAIGQMSGTSGRQRVPTDSLDYLIVPIPPLRQQRAIAHILGTLDDKIELNRRMNETLEGMARALFKSWFVDFDPVRAKMESRWRRGESLPSLPAEYYDLFPDRLVESELGEIPEGWRIVSLPKIIEINPSRYLRKGESAPYLGMASMPTKGHVPDMASDRPYGSGMRFTNGDTLVARITPCLENGKMAYVDFLQHGRIGWGSTEYIVMRPKPPLPNEFAYCLARSTYFREFAIQSMTGTSGRQRVPAKAFSEFLIPTPSKSVAETFGLFVQPLIARVREAVRESRTLAARRDTLLPRLVSGTLRARTPQAAQ